MRVIFKKAWRRFVVGNIATVDHKLAKELLDKKIAVEYGGTYPPKEKTKINLKDLK